MRAVDFTYLKSFCLTASLDVMVCLYKQRIRWIKSQVNDQTQRVNVSWDLLHHESSATSRISQRFILEPVLFNILISG